MLPMPNSIMTGYESGGDTTTYADWVEASVLFSGERVSKADVRDYFYEENTFRRESTDEVVDNVWSELERRQRLLCESFPVALAGQRIKQRMNWTQCPAYSFCLLVSYSKSNKEWMHQACHDYQEQGVLFEHVTADALRETLNTWEVDRLGWCVEDPQKLCSHIDKICMKLGERPGLEKPRPAENDGGVDVMCYRAFPDCRGDYPVFFVQCSTGVDWVGKRGQNALNLWTNWIDFRAPQLLSRVFAVPFSLCDEAFAQTQMRVNGLVLDRIRLFSSARPEEEWLDAGTRHRIGDWLKVKLETLDGAAEAT
jgi:hypothetical protein